MFGRGLETSNFTVQLPELVTHEAGTTVPPSATKVTAVPSMAGCPQRSVNRRVNSDSSPSRLPFRAYFSAANDIPVVLDVKPAFGKPPEIVNKLDTVEILGDEPLTVAVILNGVGVLKLETDTVTSPLALVVPEDVPKLAKASTVELRAKLTVAPGTPKPDRKSVV